jgi:hypothetical protein
MFRILVDADASPVKQEVCRVAKRYGIKVVMAADYQMVAPPEKWLGTAVVDPQINRTFGERVSLRIKWEPVSGGIRPNIDVVVEEISVPDNRPALARL